ncbi:hypothetical protein A1O3_06150 [Capronia epimyces CBS 606.96]|uniref:Uncharacterized protein n=1 Tax=Capronia epimyces CBS 606.96 TaxID=1182542 RepID=W9XPA3_9EURO|nr:uncharacterized protein A1O3_06150 [Capronia epimyces CBS 606.96]EXJ82337.1 hypothetical protein A1O3_06150 [Capronia epimyces CBS 606.96]
MMRTQKHQAEPLGHECGRNYLGQVIRLPRSAQRLQNEYAALEIIRANTTIPVSKILEFSENENEKGIYKPEWSVYTAQLLIWSK